MIERTVLGVSFDQTKAQLRTAKLHYDKMLPNFEHFPAIKEAKTSAKSKAEREYHNLEGEVYVANKRLEELVRSLSDTILQGVSTQEQTSAPGTSPQRTDLTRQKCL